MSDDTLKISKLVEMVKSYEHPGYKRLNNVSGEVKYKLKCFAPKFLTSLEWYKDKIESTIDLIDQLDAQNVETRDLVNFFIFDLILKVAQDQICERM